MRTAQLLTCLALPGIFVIEDPLSCGAPPDYRQRAINHLEQGAYDQAISAAQRAIRNDRNAGSLHLIVALAHLGKGRTEDAFAALERAVLLEPDNQQIHASLRQIFLQEERLDRARDIFETLLQHEPDNGPGKAGLGWAYIHLGEEEKALSLLQQATAHNDSDLFAHVQLSRIYAQRERMAEATQVLEDALAIDPDNLQLLLTLGEYRLRQDQLEEADHSFKDALHKSENRAATATHIAQVYYAQGRRRKAIEYYERAVEYGPLAPLVLNNLAWTYAEEGVQLDRALELSLQSLKADEDNVVYLDTYAELFYKKGKYGHALALMQRALELEPEDGEHHRYLREQMQKFRRALKDSGRAATRL